MIYVLWICFAGIPCEPYVPTHPAVVDTLGRPAAELKTVEYPTLEACKGYQGILEASFNKYKDIYEHMPRPTYECRKQK
jgi:hypothetical protein